MYHLYTTHWYLKLNNLKTFITPEIHVCPFLFISFPSVAHAYILDVSHIQSRILLYPSHVSLGVWDSVSR